MAIEKQPLNLKEGGRGWELNITIYQDQKIEKA